MFYQAVYWVTPGCPSTVGNVKKTHALTFGTVEIDTVSIEWSSSKLVLFNAEYYSV